MASIAVKHPAAAYVRMSLVLQRTGHLPELNCGGWREPAIQQRQPRTGPIACHAQSTQNSAYISLDADCRAMVALDRRQAYE